METGWQHGQLRIRLVACGMGAKDIALSSQRSPLSKVRDWYQKQE